MLNNLKISIHKLKSITGLLATEEEIKDNTVAIEHAHNSMKEYCKYYPKSFPAFCLLKEIQQLYSQTLS